MITAVCKMVVANSCQSIDDSRDSPLNFHLTFGGKLFARSSRCQQTAPKWGQSSEVNDNRDNHFDRCILATWHDLWTGGLTLSSLADSDVKAK